MFGVEGAVLSAISSEINVSAVQGRKRSLRLSWILFALALGPILYIAYLIYATAVNILYVDDWGYIFLFRHLVSHTLTLQDLIAQHNESRPFLPVLILLGVGSQTHWDVRFEMWIEFIFACVVSLNLLLLSRRVMGMNRNQCLFLWVITNMLLFSAEQSQNWTFAIQMIFFMPMMFISAAMLVAYSRMDVTLKFVLAMVLATASTWSHAIGQIAWIILLPPLIVGSRGQRWFKVPHIAVWVIVCVVNMWGYYRDYYKPPWHPSMLLALKEPVQATEYFTGYLGAALAQGYHRVWASIFFGFLLLVFLVMACVYIWRIRKEEGIVEPAIAWLMLCAFALASACTATAGRLGFGVIQSQESRYTGFSVYLVIGLVYLGAIIVRDVYRKGDIVGAQLRAVVGVAFLVIPHISTEIGGVHQMWVDRHVRLETKAVAQLLNIFPNPTGVYMVATDLMEKDFLDQQGYLSPGLLKNPDLSLIAGKGSGDAFGRIDAMTLDKDGNWHALGWAILPYRRDPGEIVLLAGEDGSGSAIAFKETIVGGKRPDVVTALHYRWYKETGWGTTFKASEVPAGTKTISAWVYDPETGKAHRLGKPKPFIPQQATAPS
jgi:hypothetical protein